jgi:hypothetical protein
MAQRIHICPNCSASVEVPDNYLRARIQCANCGAVLDRKSGAMLTQASSAPQAVLTQPRVHPNPQRAAVHPAPAYPVPVYPASVYTAPIGKKKFPLWAISLIVGGAVVFALVAGLAVWLGVESRAPSTDEWVTYTAPDGHFTAKFPQAPIVTTRDVGNGVVVTFTICESFNDHWEISWARISGEQFFDFHAAMQASTEETGGKLTKHEPRQHQGMDGMYGEVDNGRFKILLFRSGERVWTVAVRGNPELFDFFVENLRLSDKALGIEPLTLEVGKGIEVFEETEAVMFPGVVHGGRMPYAWRVNGKLPAGMRESYQDGNMVPFQRLRYEGYAGKAGKYEFSLTVTDADGRTASGKGSLVVRALPDSIGTLSGETAIYDGLYGGATTHGLTPVAPVGIKLGGSAQFKPNAGLYTGKIDLSWDELPEWLTLNSRIPFAFEGVPPAAGEFAFKVYCTATLHGSKREYTDNIEFRIVVSAVPESQVPQSVGKIGQGGFRTLDVTLGTGQGINTYFSINADKPANWDRNREWKVTGEWDVDFEALKASIPAGMFIQFAEWSLDDEFPEIQLGGVPTEKGEWTFDLKAVLHVKYIDEPYEVNGTVRITVK